MEDIVNLAEAVRALGDQYLTKKISLNTLVHRGEALLEQNKSVVPSEKWQRALNCIYVVEEINALLLDESRSMRDDERLRVTVELQKLTSMVTDI